MDYAGIINKITNHIVHIRAMFNNGKGWSGTGVIIDEAGTAVTANHLLKDSVNSDNSLKSIDVLTSSSNRFVEYTAVLSDVSVCGDVVVDIALLKPVDAVVTSYLTVSERTIINGDEVIMAGFGNEIVLFDRFNIERTVDNTFEFLIYRRGMISQTLTINQCDCTMQIDNVMSEGASGGPVVNEYGHIVGIVSKSAVSTEGTISVPHVSTVAVSSLTLRQLLKDNYEN